MHNHQHSFDPEWISKLNCLCELCDCGCFDLNQQPHSLSCKKLLPRSNSRNNETNESEYRLSYKNQPTKKQHNLKVPDSVSFEPKSQIHDENAYYSQSHYFDRSNENARKSPYSSRSDTSDRMSNKTSYNSEYFDKSESHLHYKDNSVPNFSYHLGQSVNSYTKPNALQRLKQEYLRNFDEANDGFADNFSASKGKASFLRVPAVSSDNVSEYDFPRKDSTYLEQARVYENLKLRGALAREEFRPLWIPKKSTGRNLFASHIDSTIFPDKKSSHFESAYARNNRHTFDSIKPHLAKKPQSMQSSRVAENVVSKHMGYITTVDNGIIPIIKFNRNSIAPETMVPDKKFSLPEIFPSSTYKSDYDKSARPRVHDHLCQFMSYKILIDKDKRLAGELQKQQLNTLDVLQRRQNELKKMEYFTNI